MDSIRSAGIITFFLVLIGILCAGCITAPAQVETTTTPAPGNLSGPGGAFTPQASPVTWTTIPVTDIITGKEFTIQDLSREGRPVIIHTFAVWCSTCAIQLSESTRLARENPGKYTVLCMDIDPREDAQAIRNHVSKNGYNGLFIAAPPEISNGLIQAYGNRAVLKLPVTIIICNNKATYIGDGAFRAETLKDIMNRAC